MNEGYFILKITVDSLLTNTSLRQTPGVGPCRFPVISLFNYTLYRVGHYSKTNDDTFKTVNWNLTSALCREKYLKTEVKVL